MGVGRGGGEEARGYTYVEGLLVVRTFIARACQRRTPPVSPLMEAVDVE